jgi:hypothetical protein
MLWELGTRDRWLPDYVNNLVSSTNLNIECSLSPLGNVMRSFVGEDENQKGIGLRIVNPVSSKTSL